MTCRRRDFSFNSCTIYTAVLRRASRRRAAAWWPAEQGCSRTHRVRRSDDRFQRANFVRTVHRSSATVFVALRRSPYRRRRAATSLLASVLKTASIINPVCVPLSQYSALARHQSLSEGTQYRQHLNQQPAGRCRRAALRKAAARSKRAVPPPRLPALTRACDRRARHRVTVSHRACDAAQASRSV